ncbi:hypothetical protein PoB_000737300 [Plakobranchus ocellatus]|uniref:Uncharacterized protein n=1 Tax=Plakobranchus ocellatus TaxID=259542 RepID=A0AAV3YEG6_9GAST|nr:hypothetical protein PoB_000737300 [Plakobranchus ocellatus]
MYGAFFPPLACGRCLGKIKYPLSHCSPRPPPPIPASGYGEVTEVLRGSLDMAIPHSIGMIITGDPGSSSSDYQKQNNSEHWDKECADLISERQTEMKRMNVNILGFYEVRWKGA